MDPAYSRFLRTADLVNWQASLDQYQAMVRDAQDKAAVPLARLREGLCIAQYTAWLKSLRGEDQKPGDGNAHELFAAVANERDLTASADGVVVNSVIAACRGYTDTARSVLEAHKIEVPVEIA